MRIGHGFDVHRLVAGRPLRLGGIEVPHDRGLLGHSDGDAALHAVCDAILGALGEGDIGGHFPDDDSRHEAADSGDFLRTVVERMRAAAYAVGNLDLTIYAEQPRIAPYAAAMRRRLAELLGVEPERVNLKAKTMEGLGPIGAGEAIAATAIVLLEGGAST